MLLQWITVLTYYMYQLDSALERSITWLQTMRSLVVK